MNQTELIPLLEQIIAALESSIPHTPSAAALAQHWSARNAATDALWSLQEATEQSKTK